MLTTRCCAAECARRAQSGLPHSGPAGAWCPGAGQPFWHRIPWLDLFLGHWAACRGHAAEPRSLQGYRGAPGLQGPGCTGLRGLMVWVSSLPLAKCPSSKPWALFPFQIHTLRHRLWTRHLAQFSTTQHDSSVWSASVPRHTQPDFTCRVGRSATAFEHAVPYMICTLAW